MRLTGSVANWSHSSETIGVAARTRGCRSRGRPRAGRWSPAPRRCPATGSRTPGSVGGPRPHASARGAGTPRGPQRSVWPRCWWRSWTRVWAPSRWRRRQIRPGLSRARRRPARPGGALRAVGQGSHTRPPCQCRARDTTTGDPRATAVTCPDPMATATVRAVRARSPQVAARKSLILRPRMPAGPCVIRSTEDRRHRRRGIHPRHRVVRPPRSTTTSGYPRSPADPTTTHHREETT